MVHYTQWHDSSVVTHSQWPDKALDSTGTVFAVVVVEDLEFMFDLKTLIFTNKILLQVT